MSTTSRIVESLRTFYLDDFVAFVNRFGFTRFANRIQRLLVRAIATILRVRPLSPLPRQANHMARRRTKACSRGSTR